MVLHWPQVTLLVLMVLGLGVSLARNGQYRHEKYSFGFDVVAKAILLFLLFKGGFFN